MQHKLDIIDIHAHIYPDKISAKAVSNIGSFYNEPMEGKGTAQDLAKHCRQAGIQKAVISSSATTSAQVKNINDFIAHICHDYPHFIGLGTLHHHLDDPKAEVERILKLGLKGIKIHPDFQKIEIDHPLMFPLYEAVEGRLPILFHIGDNRIDYSNPLRLSRILKSFPGLTVIAAHLGAYRMWDRLGEFFTEKNVYLDTSSTLMYIDKEQAAKFIRSYGADKILFGTDYPMWTHKNELQRFLSLGLTFEENKKILAENAKKLFGI